MPKEGQPNPLPWLPQPLKSAALIHGASAITALATLPGCQLFEPVGKTPTRTSQPPVAEVKGIQNPNPTATIVELSVPSSEGKLVQTDPRYPKIVPEHPERGGTWHYKSNLKYEIDLPMDWYVAAPFLRNYNSSADSGNDNYLSFNRPAAYFIIIRNKNEFSSFDAIVQRNMSQSIENSQSFLLKGAPKPTISRRDFKVNGYPAVEVTYFVDKKLMDPAKAPALANQSDKYSLSISILVGTTIVDVLWEGVIDFEVPRKVVDTMRITNVG